MLSRIADALYWMSRYLERVDNTARLVEINLLHMLEAEDALSEAAQWRPLLAISSSEDAFAACYGGAAVTADRVIQFITSERTNANAIWVSLRVARENARVVRDRISREMWEAMNELWLSVDRQLRDPAAALRAPGLYAAVRNAVARFHGVSVSTMMRGEAFGFYLLGTFLERADMTARILDVKYHLLLPDLSLIGSPLDYYQWAALLKSLSGFEAYRRTYHAGMRPIDVAELVVLEATFPRSLRFAVDRMEQALADVDARGESCAVVVRLRELLASTTADGIIERGLHEFLEEFLADIGALHGALASEFLEARYRADPCTT
jgi:uncharacterized alpha-E superfamily protein